MRLFTAFCLLAATSALANTYITQSRFYIDEEGRPSYIGRMGDQMIAYAKAKWFSHKFHIPFLYREFPYAKHFLMTEREPNRVRASERIKERAIPFHEADVEQEITDGVCYAVSYPQGSRAWEWKWDVGTWTDAIQDEEYLKELRWQLTPRMEIPTLSVPEGIRTVAVHIRKGSYYDTDGFFSEQLFDIYPEESPKRIQISDSFMDVGEPYKFPPTQYYINRIKDLSLFFEHEPLHVVLFTDFHTPEVLLSQLKRRVGLDTVTYSIASDVDFEPMYNGFAPAASSSIRDLFLMTQCDCLIRSGSNFAQLAHLLGDFEVVYFPLEAVWYDTRLSYNRIGCRTKKPL